MAGQHDLLNAQSLAFIEGLYEQYLIDVNSVPDEWRTYFDGMHNGHTEFQSGWSTQSPFPSRSMFNPAGGGATNGTTARPGLAVAERQEKLDQLIRNFRVRGHIMAQIDPLGHVNDTPIELEPSIYGFTESDFDREVSTSYVGGPETRTLRGIINWLKQTYCRSIGVQFMHIDSLACRTWLAERMESTGNRIKLARDEQLRILKRLADAIVFEEFLAKKFVGAKSFSLEGAESLIPLLDIAIEKMGNEGVEQVVIGMAHRGRLNVLANIMGKSPRQIFREFDDADPEMSFGRGDVKYHLGYSADWKTSQGHRVHISLCCNPSHLEFVNTVAMGRLRSKQDRNMDFDRDRGACILIHGDAAFAGEGVVQETLNLSELQGYAVGGTIHVVVNNQVGFTTNPSEGRSTTYATDIAKMLQIPIFHVNGEDPEAVAQAMNLALDFRKRYKRDAVIDMYCYRRRGHNEGDEPSFTQPVMYQKIRERKSVYEGYLEHLLNFRSVTREEAEKLVEERREKLEHELTEARRDDYIRCLNHWGGVWAGYFGGPAAEADAPETGLPVDQLSDTLNKLTEFPKDFHPHAKVKRLLGQRQKMAAGEQPLDWGAAELLAFGTLLAGNHPIRLSGQDVRRGTFSHRHAYLFDSKDGTPFNTLSNINDDESFCSIFNSPLSEAGVLGFEYGYSLDCPEGLTVWEAQFGDFANAAQVIIDQFIASAEDKWDRLSGLVLLLPHGFEGQGPEHSSARLERFLMLAAEDNMQIVQPTTPAQLFHMLRRQALRKWKKPLVVMTPKSLLRLKECVSSLDELAYGQFQPVIPDDLESPPETIKQILLCTGKVYYDLVARRQELGRNDVAILRLEELFPFPYDEISQLLAAYPDGTPVAWVQEEPSNMGAWPFLSVRFGSTFLDRFPFERITRPASASPATGSSHAHKHEQEMLLEACFAS